MCQPSPPPIHIHQWILDTRPLWPVTATAPPKAQMSEFKTSASRALSLLTAPERAAILKYHFPNDARMALGSALLKRFVITTLSPPGTVPWHAALATRGANGKPSFVNSQARGGYKIAFNVSHQAGLVVVVACACAPAAEEAVAAGEGRGEKGEDGEEVELGADVVCVDERDDYGRVEREGFFKWVDMHADVFAAAEVQALKMDSGQLGIPLLEGVQLTGYARDGIARCQRVSGPAIVVGRVNEGDGDVERVVSGRAVVEAKLRGFYALWCLREAYVKMTGEALLAAWLGELEFRKFGTPARATSYEAQEHEQRNLEWGGVETDFEIWFKGKRIDNVVMELRALGRDYMVASAARYKGEGDLRRLVFSGFRELDLERDIYAVTLAA